MRILIMSVLLLVSSLSAEAGWMSEAGLALCSSGQPYRAYRLQGRCQEIEGATCYSSEDCRVETVAPRRRGPWEAAQSVEPCLDDDCSDELIAKVCPDGTYSPFSGDLDEDGSLETWCARRSLVVVIGEDAALKAIEDQRLADIQARRDALAQINTRLVQCARMDLGSVTPAQVAQCVRAVAKELVKAQLQNNEL